MVTKFELQCRLGIFPLNICLIPLFIPLQKKTKFLQNKEAIFGSCSILGSTCIAVSKCALSAHIENFVTLGIFPLNFCPIPFFIRSNP